MSRTELLYGYGGLDCRPSDRTCRQAQQHLDAIVREYQDPCGTGRVWHFRQLTRMGPRAVPVLVRALDLDGYVYTHTAAMALCSMGAAAEIHQWCASHASAESAAWVCTGKSRADLWPQM